MKNIKKGDRVIINTLAKKCSFLPQLEGTVTFIYDDGNLFDFIEDNGKVHEAISFDNCRKISDATESKKYLFVKAENIDWDIENVDLPTNANIEKYFLASKYRNSDGSLDKLTLSEDVVNLLSDIYGYCINELDVII